MDALQQKMLLQAAKTEVRVTFFPSGRATAHRTFPSRDLARAFAENDVAGWAPLIEERVIATTPWAVVENPSAAERSAERETT